MRMVRDVATVDRLPYLARLGFDPDDAGRLAVAEGRADQTGLYVNVESGESRFFSEGDPMPDGIWVAQREIDDLRPDGGAEASPAGHGFGEGWGTQDEQLGGDRSYPEEDTGGTRRVPHGGVAENQDPYVGNPAG
ncbi:MAG: hypothetical protein QOF01_3534 [Thermomicrobiales bacterium]|jgi:hypothetical protein|nr:hypothetical protein [Thermomicrobiales bacterium]